MASMSHLLLVLLGTSYLVNQTAAVSGGPGDALALVQQRAHVETQSSSLATILAESFRANPNAHDDIIGKIIGKVGEERLHRFWEKVIEIGRTPNMSRPLRGLLLVQESGKVIGAARANPLTEWIYEKKAYLEQGKSEPTACWVTRAGVLADIGDLTIAIAYPAGQSCNEPAVCLASAFDVVRALVYTIRDITAARYSYCADAVSAGKLCQASSLGVFGELAGVVHSSISLGYKCNTNSYKAADASSQTFGFNARAFMCSWDITRASAYALAGIYRAIWWYYLGTSEASYVNDEGKILRKTRGVEEIGQSGPSYGLMALGGFAWVTNAIIAGAGNCPDNSGTSSSKNSGCFKEAAELSAYAFQTFGYFQNFRDYCMDVFDKNAIRAEAGTEEEFRMQAKALWEQMRKYVPKEISPEDLKVIIDAVYSDEAGVILKDELRKSMSSAGNRPIRKSMSRDEMESVLRDVERAIDVGLTPHSNPRLSVGRLSVLRDRKSTVSATGNDKRLSVSNRLSIPSTVRSNDLLTVQSSDLLSPKRVVQGVPVSTGNVDTPKLKPHRSIAGIKVTNDPESVELPIVINEPMDSSKTKKKQPEIPVTIREVDDESNQEDLLDKKPLALPPMNPTAKSKMKTSMSVDGGNMVPIIPEVEESNKDLVIKKPPPPPPNRKMKTIGGFSTVGDRLEEVVSTGNTVVENPEQNIEIDNTNPKSPEAIL